MKTSPLWKHQEEAILRAKSLDHFGLLFQPGCGKTRTVIHCMMDKYDFEGRDLRTLVICPSVVCENFRREIVSYTNIPENKIRVLLGKGVDRYSQFLTGVRDGVNIFITNYEGLTTKTMTNIYGALLDWSPEVLICDESQRLKNFKAKRTEAVIKLADRSKYRYILSGTPILNSLQDIFSQFRVLDLGKTFGKNFYAFQSEFFYDKNKDKKAYTNITWSEWAPKPHAEELISALIKPVSLYVEKAQCLDLPPFVRKTLYVEMGKAQKKAYDEMKTDLVTMVNDKACVAELAVTKALRLQQIVSGFMKVEELDGSESFTPNISFDDNPRIEALKETLEDLVPYHKVIVWACFKENYAQIRKACEDLGAKYVELHGDTSSQEKQISMDSFNNDPTIRVLIGNQGAGGVGVNLIAASYAIYYSRNFSLEHDVQSEARNFRGGSEIHEKITRIDLVCPGTIDELALRALREKQAMSDSVLLDMARRL